MVVTTSRGACFIALHEGSAAVSKLPCLFSSLEWLDGSCIAMTKVALQKSSVE